MITCFFCGCLLSWQAFEPFQIDFATRQFEPIYLHQQYERLRSVVPPNTLPRKREKDFEWPANFSVPEDFERTSGRATYLTGTAYETLGFEALPDESSFRLQVEATRTFSGSDAEFEDFGHKVTIQPMPRIQDTEDNVVLFNPDGTVKEKYTQKGTETHTFGKAHIAYLDRLSVGGPEFAFKVTGNQLRKDIEVGRQWDWGHISFPQRLPLNIRTAGIGHWNRTNGVELQKRDEEEDFTFDVRNSVLSLQQEWRERLWLDANLFKWWIIEPTSKTALWKFDLTLSSLPETTLANQIGDLRPVSFPQIDVEGPPLCRISIGAQLPEQYRKVLEPLVTQLTASDSIVRTAALQILESGRLSGQAVVFLDQQGHIIANAAGSMGTQTLPLESLAAFLKGIVSGKIAEAPLALTAEGCDLPLMSFADVDGSTIRFAASRPDVARGAFPKITDDTNPPGVLISVTGDLKPLLSLPAEHPSAEVVDQLERFHHYFTLPKMTSGKMSAEEKRWQAHRERMDRLLPGGKKFIPLRGRLSTKDDFSFHLEVKTDSRNVIKVKARVGEGLWTYWRCRSLLRKNPAFR